MRCASTWSVRLLAVILTGTLGACSHPPKLDLSADEQRSQLALSVETSRYFPIPKEQSHCVADAAQPQLSADGVYQLLQWDGSMRNLLAADRSVMIQSVNRCVQMTDIVVSLYELVRGSFSAKDQQALDSVIPTLSQSEKSCIGEKLSALGGAGDVYQLLVADHDIPADPEQVFTTYTKALTSCLS